MNASLRIDNPGGVDLPVAGEAILRAMFARHARLVIESELAGGFSGCQVLQVVPFRAGGVAELPAVVKLGPTGLIAQEAGAYHALIRGCLSGTPEIWGDPVSSPDGRWSGLRYALVGNGLFAFESLARYAGRARLEDLWQVVENRLFVHLSTLWDAATPGVGRRFGQAYDRVLPVNAIVRPATNGPASPRTLIHPADLPDRPLRLGEAVAIEGFSVAEVDALRGLVTLDLPAMGGAPSASYRLRLAVDAAEDDVAEAYAVGQPLVAAIQGVVVDTREAILLRSLQAVIDPDIDLGADSLVAPLSDGRPCLPNPLFDLAARLHLERPANIATVHGDLNLENILVDPEARSVRIIDFAQSREDDVLHDLLRIETGVLTLLVPAAMAKVGYPAEAICGLLDAVNQASAVGDGPALDPAREGLPDHPDLDRARLLLLLIRKRAAPLLYRRGDWSEYHAGLTAYLLGASRYRNLDAMAQRAAFWAAASACRHADAPLDPDFDAGRLQAAIDRLIGVVDAPARRALRQTLPLPATAVFGREADVEAVFAALIDGRCVTIVGAGGVGKTRLALEVADALSGELEDGVWFVPLASVSSAAEIDHALAAVIGVAEPVGATLREAVLRHLAARSGLVVLDNCEQVMKACRTLVELLAWRCPDLLVLATSREALQLPGERVWPLQPLGVPEEGDGRSPERLLGVPAVRLLVDRVRRVRPGFTLSSATAPAVVRICRELDGLPLAIELAAARARVMTVDQIAERLGQQLGFLRQEGQIATPHHRTIEATVGWSFVLLEPEERDLLLRLAVFTGGFTLEAAAICMDPQPAEGSDFELLDRVASLVEKSLVLAPGEQSRIPRYRLLGPIRAFSLERLRSGDAWAGMAERHAAWFLVWAERAAGEISGSAQAVWLDQLALEHGNLSAALRCLVDQGDGPRAARLVVALSRYWSIRGRFAEGRDWCQAVLALGNGAGDGTVSAGLDALAQAAVYDVAGDLARHQGDLAEARAAFERGLAMREASGDRGAVAATLRRLGNVADLQGHYDEAEGYMQASLEEYRVLDDGWGVAAVLNNLGLLASHGGDFGLARERLAESLMRFRALDEVWAVGVTLLNLGNVAFDQRAFADAEGYYADSLEIAHSLDDRVGIASALRALGNVAGERADFAGARRFFAESLAVFRALDDRKNIAELLESCAAIDAMDGRALEAVYLYAAAAGLREAIGYPLVEKDAANHAAELASLRAVLGDAAFEQAWRRGGLQTWTEVAEGVLADGDARG